jgi:ATP synthase protein I
MSIIHPVRGGSDQQAAANENFAPMSAEQAKVWRANNPGISPWWVVLAQFGLGLLVSVLAGLLTGKTAVAVSVFYGSMSVVVPAAVFARGLTSRLTSLNPGAAVVGFFFWEMVKIALTVAMLFAAPGLIEALSWPALLVGLVVTMKVYWLALAFKRKNARPTKS